MEDSFAELRKEYGDFIIAGVDARNSMVATHGWKNLSTVDALTFIQELGSCGIQEIIYTDIATDGMLSGPNIPALERILDNTNGIGLIASGGISFRLLKSCKNFSKRTHLLWCNPPFFVLFGSTFGRNRFVERSVRWNGNINTWAAMILARGKTAFS